MTQPQNIPAVWKLPKVTSWDFLKPSGGDLKKKKDENWTGTIDFVNEEPRKIGIKVQWNLQAITQMPANINTLLKRDHGSLPPTNWLDRFKAYTEHYAVEEAARLGALEVRIMATMHDFTKGSGVAIQTPDHLHVTYHIKSTEWGQKKVHVYLKDWKTMMEPIASVVFVKNHTTLGAENAGIDTGAYRAFWHSNLSYGPLPNWLATVGKTIDNPEGKPAKDLEAKVTFQYVSDRATEFQAAVENTETRPLKSCIAKLGVHMYTRLSPVVTKTFGAGNGQPHQMDYQERGWKKWNPQTKQWERLVPAPAGGSKK